MGANAAVKPVGRASRWNRVVLYKNQENLFIS